MSVHVTRDRAGDVWVNAPSLVHDLLTQFGEVFQNGTDQDRDALIGALETWALAHSERYADMYPDPDSWISDIEAVAGPIATAVRVFPDEARLLAATLDHPIPREVAS